ncbi:MAG: hypothetical protein KJ899_08880 [Gammaproteobacteria bacterium]|nr:hypothetical protein [Gammaproteobacteria bacterium]
MQNGFKGVTKEQMLGYIKAGRTAIERALLSTVMRSRPNTHEEHDAELAKLYALLDLYNMMMARYEHPKINAEAANDENGAMD